RGLFVGQHLHRFGDPHLARAAPSAGEVLEHSLDLRSELLHSRRREDLHLRRARRYLDLDLALVELALAQSLAELLPRRALLLRGRLLESDRARGRQQRVEYAL